MIRWSVNTTFSCSGGGRQARATVTTACCRTMALKARVPLPSHFSLPSPARVPDRRVLQQLHCAALWVSEVLCVAMPATDFERHTIAAYLQTIASQWSLRARSPSALFRAQPAPLAACVHAHKDCDCSDGRWRIVTFEIWTTLES